MNIFDNKLEFRGFIAAVFVLVLVIPLLNAFGSEGSFFHVSAFELSLWGKYITYAVHARVFDRSKIKTHDK